MPSKSAQASQYSVMDLGAITNLSGRAESFPTGLNDTDQVSGANVVAGAYRAVLYGSGAWKNLGTLGGAESSAAAINRGGQVVGNSLTKTGLRHPFLWTAGAKDGVASNPQMKDLGTLIDGAVEAYASGINNAGQVTGWGQTTDGYHAFVYTNGKFVDIGALVNGLPYTYGYSINDTGHVAGTAYDENYAVPRAIFYDGKATVELGTLGGYGASAIALNNKDHVVGYVSYDAGDHAFEYVGGKTTDLGTLGGHYSYANSINNSNVIVGGSFIDAADSIYHAFIASGGTMSDLNKQLDGTGTGWVLTEAKAINDGGDIVGVGTYKGSSRMFLLKQSVLQVTGVKLAGKDVLVTFPSTAGATYNVQAQGGLKTSWTNVVTIKGNGGLLTATNVGGASAGKRFYRVQQN